MRGRNLLPRLVLFAGCVLGPSSVAAAATRTAASASFSDVSAAVSAAVDGDTVQVPAGSATWSTRLLISRGISLIGAGIGNTVITSNVADKFSGLIKYSPSNPSTDTPFRLSGFSINGAAKSICIDVSNDSSTRITRVRIDHNKLTNCEQYAIHWFGEATGLVDHNQFVDNYIASQVMGRNWYSWEQFPIVAGSSQYPYFEDNSYVFTGSRTDIAFVMESGQGGRYVFRHNTIDVQSSTLGGALEMFDAHGNQDPVTSPYRPGGNRGTLGIEIYDNTISLRADHRILNLRGGDAKVFNNTVTQSGGSGSYIGMTEYDGWSYHYMNTWPGYDPVQNAFFWNNKLNGTTIAPELYDRTYDPIFIQENRDWFRPSSGAASGRPTSCGDNSYYASTDSETLWKCHPANAWFVLYAPYVYPHPLATGGTGLTNPPAAPNNVRIIK